MKRKTFKPFEFDTSNYHRKHFLAVIFSVPDAAADFYRLTLHAVPERKGDSRHLTFLSVYVILSSVLSLIQNQMT